MTTPPEALGAPLALSRAALDALMPMHVAVDPDGRIAGAGPTLARLVAPPGPAGQRVVDLFAFRRPRAPATLAQLLAHAGRRLSCVLRDLPDTRLHGVIVPADGGGALMNLSFGIGLAAAVARFRLQARDFAHTELTTDILYLIEAQAMAREEWTRLSLRLEGARSAAEAQALTDALTGLGNRRALEEGLQRLTAAGQAFGVIHLDLDRFKQVNDTLGHAAGDAVLAAVARVLRGALRSGDLAVRLGGDEFVLILPGLTEGAALASVAARMIARIEEPVPHGDAVAEVSASAGVAVWRPGMEASALLEAADGALYASKRAGRGRATMHDG